MRFPDVMPDEAPEKRFLSYRTWSHPAFLHRIDTL